MPWGKYVGAVLRAVPLALPVLAVAVVAYAVLVAGRPRSVVGVRLRGGPTAGVRRPSFRVEVVERLGDVERPIAGRPIAVDFEPRNGAPSEWRGALDAEGAAAVTLVLASPWTFDPVHARVRLGSAGTPVADGRFALSPDTWSSKARHRGGWVERRAGGSVVLRAAAERGVFAVPFASGLWVEATDGGAFAGPVDAKGDGVTVGVPTTIGPGRVRFLVTPLEHAASVVLETHTVPAAELDVALAVIPGALFAELDGNELVVRSPVLRDRAYVAIVTERERAWGGSVVLEPDLSGGARGVLRGMVLPKAGPLWAVVSSEPELASSALVGWPIRYATDGAPPTTFDVPDVLLFDGTDVAVKREARRVRRVRVLAALIAAFALGVSALSVAARAGRARKHLSAHLEDAGADPDTTARVAESGAGSTWLVVAALLSVALAAALIALFALAR